MAHRCGAKRICKSKRTKHRTQLWRGAHLQVKTHETPHAWATFCTSDVEKSHAAVARSPFASQNGQNTSGRDRFWMLRSGKMERRCGAKRICESKCTKHYMFGPLFEFQSKNRTPLWREARLQVNMFKNCPKDQVRLNFHF